jgi:hypothetical protein
MTPEDELAVLRMRAYGPDADIHKDPAAWHRLQELEAPSLAASKPDSTALAASHDGCEVMMGSSEPDDPAVTAGGSEATSSGTDLESPPRRRGFRGRAVWVSSVVIAGLMGAGIGGNAASYDPTVVAVLSEADHLGIPDDFAQGLQRIEQATRFDDFMGVQVVTSTEPFNASAPQLQGCISIRLGDVYRAGCTAGDFDPMTEIAAGAGSGASWAKIRDVYGDNAVLRFTQSGDHVVVQASNPD